MRFVLFLCTAVPYLRERAGAKRLKARKLGRQNNCAPVQRKHLPVRKSDLISSFFLSRSRLVNEYVFVSSVSTGTDTNLIRLFFVRNRKFSAPFCPSPFKDKSPCLCLHTGPKTKFTISLYSTRLICTFHKISSMYTL